MKLELKDILRNAVYVALYVVLCKIFAPISYGPIQVRIAEAMCIMVVFDNLAVVSITLACFMSNLLFGGTPNLMIDAILGSLATFIGLYLATLIKSNNFFLKMLPTIISNAIIIPFELIVLMGWDTVDVFGKTLVGKVAIVASAISVAIGEVIAIYVLGYILYKCLLKHRDNIFK